MMVCNPNTLQLAGKFVFCCFHLWEENCCLTKRQGILQAFFFPDQNCHLYTPASFAEVLAIERMSTNLYPASFVAVWNSLVVSVKPEAQTVTEVTERKLASPNPPTELHKQFHVVGGGHGFALCTSHV